MNLVSIEKEKEDLPITYKRGDVFRTEAWDFLILAQVATELYDLISLVNGNRFHNSGVPFENLCSVIKERGFIKILPKTEIKLVVQ